MLAWPLFAVQFLIPVTEEYWQKVTCVQGFLDSSVGKESVCNVGDPGLIPVLGRSPGEGTGYPLQYSGLENSMDCPWGRKELDMTEQLSLSLFTFNMCSALTTARLYRKCTAHINSFQAYSNSDAITMPI